MTTQTLTRSSSETNQNFISESSGNSLAAKMDTKQLNSGSEPYQAVQQLKYLHLQLEIDVLLQELQTTTLLNNQK